MFYVVILFSIRLRIDSWRILFQHDNNELYQLDIPISVYENRHFLEDRHPRPRETFWS